MLSVNNKISNEEQRGTVAKVFDSGAKGPRFNSR